jgi:hypothetical protein
MKNGLNNLLRKSVNGLMRSWQTEAMRRYLRERPRALYAAVRNMVCATLAHGNNTSLHILSLVFLFGGQ